MYAHADQNYNIQFYSFHEQFFSNYLNQRFKCNGMLEFIPFTIFNQLQDGTFTKITQNVLDTELNDLRIIICLRKSEATVERISVCNVIENLAEHGIHCLPCSYSNNVIDLLY